MICSWPRFCEQAAISRQVPAYWRTYEIQAMGVASLYSWELSRLTIAASERDTRVLIATNSIPPFLNVARIEWVSLYTGQRAFAGPSNVNSIVENGEGLELEHTSVQNSGNGASRCPEAD